ncbi:hypothetical protein ACC704_36985, partial [Rhizobium johnstonii]|uniref:hypothetical protein n=1 Tax=Rhizobium johnstonii TaxID=3019933 RepID=UPI003F9A447D
RIGVRSANIPPIENGPVFPGRFAFGNYFALKPRRAAEGRAFGSVKNLVDKPGQMAKSMTLKGDIFRNNGITGGVTGARPACELIFH